jgi:hypothetical protein
MSGKGTPKTFCNRVAAAPGPVWVQGYVVAAANDTLTIDDGTARLLVLSPVAQARRAGADPGTAEDMCDMKAGEYAMVVGRVSTAGAANVAAVVDATDWRQVVAPRGDAEATWILQVLDDMQPR